MTHTSENAQCISCGEPTPAGASFCPACGVKQGDHRRPLLHLAGEFIEHTFHFDNKTWHTLRIMFRRPGLVALDYSAGKRHQYVAPLQFYVFLSFILFMMLPLSPLFTHPAALAQKESNDLAVHFNSKNLKPEELIELNDKQVEALLVAKGIKANWFERRIMRVAARFANEGKNLRAEFTHRILKGISYAMFFLMPWFAFLTWLFFHRHRLFYIEHLEFSLYFHCQMMLLLILGKIAVILTGQDLFILAALVVAIVYLHLALRRIFGRGTWRTLFSTLTIGILHMIAVLACTVAVVVSVFLFL